MRRDERLYLLILICLWRGLGLSGFCGLCVERTGWGAGVRRVLWAVCGKDWGLGGWDW